MRVKPIEREINNHHCSVCEGYSHQVVAEFQNVPNYLGCVDFDQTQDTFISFQLFICKSCGLIGHSAISDTGMYDLLHSEAVGDIWQQHHSAFLAYIKAKIGDYELNKILEIGPSTTPLSRRILDQRAKSEVDITYCDLIKEAPFDLRTDETYLNAKYPVQLSGQDLIFASHVFEHSENMFDFLQASIENLRKGRSFFISIPNFEEWISKFYWNAITAEHTVYPFREHLEFLAVRLGIKYEIEFFRQHSVFTQYVKDSCSSSSAENFQFNIGKSKDLAMRWIDSINDSIEIINSKLEELNQSDYDTCIIVGASHLSQYPLLISDDLSSRVEHVIDNSPTKTNKRLFGTKLVCQKFDYIKNFKKPLIIVFPSPYLNEMIKQINELNPNSHVVHI